MRRVFLNLGLFAALAVIISNFSGCSNTAGSQVGASDESVAGAPPSGESAEPKKESAYPSIPAKLAQGDLKNLDGSLFKIADRGGKVLLVNMWATWCGPCRAEMPALVKMQEEHRDQGFEVIGLNVDDESVEDINAFASEMNLNYALVWADMDLQAELLKISRFEGIPQSFIIDREGRLRAIFKGAGPGDVRKMGEIVSQIVSE